MEINFAGHQLVSIAAARAGVTQKRPGRMRRRLDINTTPIEQKKERCCSRRQQFRHYCGSSGRRNNKQDKNCRWLQPRSVLGSIGVMLMSCKVNFHVTQSALQNSLCLPSIFC